MEQQQLPASNYREKILEKMEKVISIEDTLTDVYGKLSQPVKTAEDIHSLIKLSAFNIFDNLKFIDTTDFTKEVRKCKSYISMDSFYFV